MIQAVNIEFIKVYL